MLLSEKSRLTLTYIILMAAYFLELSEFLEARVMSQAQFEKKIMDCLVRYGHMGFYRTMLK